ncbi:phosphotransferase family protein [Actinacidiphila acididurans]|uniref:Aminoglycoside phosphotransferase family protein n=1 Tax=Actinacidiphila acididurans TaxID=2784346 RepID=A0ABS2U180_9ACTN|nr:aminoglycoside phosphotransferase family protein [Actinacidiphila acididurans]MBM9508481.1 aminoglycoside phosphotransferase family protein [Actinacidiphila acididurans]
MSERFAELDRLAEQWGLSGLEPVGKGLEFSVYRAQGRDGLPVAVRLAHRRFDSNANDPHVDTRALLLQEYAIARHLAAHGLPVAEARELVLADDPALPDVLLSAYVPDDGSELDSFALGQLLARLHQVPPPRLTPVASEAVPTARAIAARIGRRWARIGDLVDDWPEPPDASLVAERLAGLTEDSLLHLDVRSDNIRRRHGRAVALLDWSNALLGPPALEFGRLVEYARYPENELDMEAIRSGYATLATVPPDSDPCLSVCRLDAALMLALVFLSEAPDPSRGPAAADHARELALRTIAPHA